MTRLLFQLGLRSSGRTPGPVAVRLISISGPSWRYPPGWVGEVYHTLEGRRSANPLRSVNRVTKPHGTVAMDLDLNRYDVEHVCTAHSKMSTKEWQDIYFSRAPDGPPSRAAASDRRIREGRWAIHTG